MPHSEHSVRVSVRDRPAAAGPEPGRNATPERLDLQGLQRLGSFLNCLSKKKSCSPAVKINSPPQSVQVKSRSTNSIAASPVVRKGWLPEIHVVQKSAGAQPRWSFLTRSGPGAAKSRIKCGVCPVDRSGRQVCHCGGRSLAGVYRRRIFGGRLIA
jgi:hypothetical protein